MPQFDQLHIRHGFLILEGHTYYQYKDDFMKKNSWQKKRSSILGRVKKLEAMKVHNYTCW